MLELDRMIVVFSFSKQSKLHRTSSASTLENQLKRSNNKKF